jgi:hypothetical protein
MNGLVKVTHVKSDVEDEKSWGWSNGVVWNGSLSKEYPLQFDLSISTCEIGMMIGNLIG